MNMGFWEKGAQLANSFSLTLGFTVARLESKVSNSYHRVLFVVGGEE